MNPFSFPLRYLALESESGSKLWIRDLLGMFFVTLVMSLPYLAVPTSNYFHKDGFVDKIGAFSSVLTGFYIAGLVAVSTFPRNKDGLDKKIENGKIRVPAKGDDPSEYLTRREYVCAMFGYLAFMSMLVTIVAITCVTVSPWFDSVNRYSIEVSKEITLSYDMFRAFVICIWSFILSSIFVTTVRALYYLIDRLYATVPTPLPRKEDGGSE